MDMRQMKPIDLKKDRVRKTRVTIEPKKLSGLKNSKSVSFCDDHCTFINLIFYNFVKKLKN